MQPSSRQRSLPGIEAESTPKAPPLEGSSDTLQPVEGASLKGKTAYILDTHALMFQVFHALPNMTSPSGEAVAAVYGITRDVFYLLDEKRPDFLVAAFDMPGPTFRHEIYQDYKADRGEMPEELVPQIPKIKEVLGALGVPVLQLPSYEADDVLATFARVCEENGVSCRLVTSDKDCRQLISDLVTVYNVRNDEVVDAEGLHRIWGIRPEQVVDFQALVGDKADNVPGIPLIGPKIARELLEQYGTLDAILDHADDVKGKKRSENLRQAGPMAEMSRRLVALDRHVPIEFDFAAARTGRIDAQRAGELFADFGFRGFGERMRVLATGAADRPAQPSWQARYETVASQERLVELVDTMRRQPRISIDTETTHRWPRWAELVGISFAWQPGEAYYVPIRGPDGETTLDRQEVLDALRPVLTDPAIGKIGQNLKYDMIVLRAAGIEVAGVAFDTMVASYLLDAGQRNHNLNELSRRFLDHDPIPIKDLIGTGKSQKQMDEVPIAQVGPYAAEDADLPLRLQTILQQQLEAKKLESLFRDVEVPLVEVLVEMESNGIRVDIERLAELSARYRQRLDTLETEIYELAGHRLNINSPKQLATVLFDELGLPVIRRTKSGPSTDADVLSQLAHQHALPAKIVEYRQFAKLKNTYVDALPSMVHPQTGRVHASFNQVVAATGRLSSSDPNLQNIPVRNRAGREIRSAFLPAPDCQLLAADYSQIELRVLAHFSGDSALRTAFATDEDIHARVASEVYKTPLADVTPEMRRAAKAVNFGVIYGQSAFGLANALEISQEEAANFIDAYFGRYPGVEKFLEVTLELCRQNGYVTTVLGRQRAIRGVRAGAGRQRNLPERTAINTVIQGSAADLIKLAMISIFRRLRRDGMPARLLLQIHDELIFEVPPKYLSDLGSLVTEEMVSVLALDVPLKVDVKSGDNWADCEPWLA